MQKVSQNGNDYGEGSYCSQTDNGKKSNLGDDQDALSVVNNGSLKEEQKKRKQTKKSTRKLDKQKKVQKANKKEAILSGYKRTNDSLEHFTRSRSFKIAKEREDIIEPRNLGYRVSTFCGLTPSIIQDRIQQNVEEISNVLSNYEKSDSDGYFNSPNKGSDKTENYFRANSKSKQAASTLNRQSGTAYTRRLRARRGKNIPLEMC